MQHNFGESNRDPRGVNESPFKGWFAIWVLAKTLVILLYIGDYATQLYGDYNKPLYNGMSTGLWTFVTCYTSPFFGLKTNQNDQRSRKNVRKNTEADWKIGQQRKYDQFGVFWMACISCRVIQKIGLFPFEMAIHGC